jgi:DUF4097 and DUF4098 domain-containing protein YvlB
MKYAAILVLMLLPLLALAEPYREMKEMTLPAEGINAIVIDCGAGSLNLRGAANQKDIRIKAQIEIDNPEGMDVRAFIQEKVRIALTRQATMAAFNGTIKQPFAQESEARINVMIEIPEGLDVDLIDGSGPIHIFELSGNLNINDDSGGMKIERITGRLDISDSSGGIWLDEIFGDVIVNDGSGSIHIESIAGDVQVKDGSGDITITEVKGNVIVSDGSGSIDIRDVTENVSIFIRVDGSGEVNIEGVKGKTSIRP